MQTIILCSLSNEALEPVTSEEPLEMLELCGKKILDFALDCLAENDISSCTVVTDSVDTKDYIDRMTSSEVDVNAIICMEDMPTYEVLKNVRNGEDDMMVIRTDGVFSLDLKGMKDFFEKKSGAACIYAVKSSSRNRNNENIVEFDRHNRLESFYKNYEEDFPSTNYKAAPVYIISEEMLSCELDNEDIKSEKKGLFSLLSIKKDKNIYVYADESCEAGDRKPFYEKISSPEELLNTAERMMTSGAFKLGNMIEDKVISNTPYLFRGVTFIPPVFIGKNVNIGMGSVIGNGTVIEDNASIGECADITGSYIGSYAKIGGRVKIDSAAICKNATLEKGSECERMSVVGDGGTVEENSVVSEGIRLWNRKTLKKNTRLRTNLRKGGKAEFTFSDEGCDKLISPIQAVSAGCAVGSSLNIGASVAVCSDSEECISYAKAFMSGVMSSGSDVWDLGVSNERTADFSANMLKADMYAVISANPSPKLTLRCPGGLHIKRDTEYSIERRMKTRVFRQEDISRFGKYSKCDGIDEMYISHLKSIFPKKLNNINVTVKTSSEKTAEEVDRLIYPLNDINGEEIIFHFLDNVGKVTAYSESTGYVLYERLLLLAVKAHFEKGEDVAVPFTLPCVFDETASGYNANLYRYFSSSCSSADNCGRKLALRESNRFVHDGMFLIADILKYLTESKKSFAQAVLKIPQFYSSERFISLSDKDEITADFYRKIKAKSKRSDEGIVISKNDARAIIKPMHRGKGFMLFVDAHKAETAAAMCDDIQRKLSEGC